MGYCISRNIAAYYVTIRSIFFFNFKKVIKIRIEHYIWRIRNVKQNKKAQIDRGAKKINVVKPQTLIWIMSSNRIHISARYRTKITFYKWVNSNV